MKMKMIDGKLDERQKAEKLLRARKACRYLTQSHEHMKRIIARGTIEWADEKDVVPAFVGLVRYFAYLENEELDDEMNTGLKDLGNVFHSMLLLGSLLSAEKVAQLFPPEKWYDGARYEWQDYYTARQAVEAAGGWKRFKGTREVLDFLMEMTNGDIRLCCLAGMHIMDEMREREGKQSLIESFVEQQTGEPCFLPKHVTEARDKQGRVYIVADGEVLGLKAKPRRPKWMRKIDGWKE